MNSERFFPRLSVLSIIALTLLTTTMGCMQTKDCIGGGREHMIAGYYIGAIALILIGGSGQKPSKVLTLAGVALFLYA